MGIKISLVYLENSRNKIKSIKINQIRGYSKIQYENNKFIGKIDIKDLRIEEFKYKKILQSIKENINLIYQVKYLKKI